MEHAPAPTGLLFGPPLGTRVHHWLLVDCRGHGAHGVVYLAVRAGQESEGPVALKMAMHPWDSRFAREVMLLSLVHHPSIPRLLGQGFWLHPFGAYFPFIVMEWVDGTPLYEWARQHHPSSLQVLQVLAQLARALEATHACGAVHRDVKGDNVLVRRSDGRAVLTDFGAGNYPFAARLTREALPPGTPAYRAPEAWLFERRSRPAQDAHYSAGPADDVYGLGVTAYRLVTGEYPLGPELWRDDEGSWYWKEVPLPSPQQLNPQVEPQLSALILRMLSLSPEARSTAGELAQALEAAAERVAKETGVPLLGIESLAPSAPPPALPQRIEPQVQTTAWRTRSAWGLAAAFLVLWAWQAVHMPPHSASGREQVASQPSRTDGGSTGLGEAVPEAPLPPEQEPSKQEPLSQDPPPQPFPGQLTPNEKGHCPGRKQLPINGGCWVEHPTKNAEECEESGQVFIKDRCYAPVMGSRRKPPPTSAPPDFR